MIRHPQCMPIFRIPIGIFLTAAKPEAKVVAVAVTLLIVLNGSGKTEGEDQTSVTP